MSLTGLTNVATSGETTTSVSNLDELFEHDLADVYFAEHQLLDALEELTEQTEDEEIADAFREHREETQGHIDRLERVFETIGEPSEKEECEGIEGLIREHESLVNEDPDQEVLDLHNMAAAEKTEHYEIAAYGNLALTADRLGMDEAGDLLHENLEEEKAALEKLKNLTDDFEFEQVAAQYRRNPRPGRLRPFPFSSRVPPEDKPYPPDPSHSEHDALGGLVSWG